MSLQQITAAVQSHPELGLLDFHGLNLFIRYASLARETIELSQSDQLECPISLPQQILRVLATALGEKDTRLIEICWSAFRGLVWSQPTVTPVGHFAISIRRHDLARPRSDKNLLTLTDPLTHAGTLFTLRQGALPVFTTSLYCRSCNIRYYHNYHVHKQTSLRTYYGGVPDVVHVAQHFFIESALLELFANNMVFGWLSATNCARIYNEALSTPRQHILNNKFAFTAIYHDTKHFTPDDWTLTRFIRKEDTMNGFFLYSLLLDKAEQGGILMLPHDEASQADRLKPALAERNSAMEGTGQECYAHACDLCFVIAENADGQLMKTQAAACDGNSIGHRSCKVHDCQNPLPNLRHHFCVKHQHLSLKCAVIDCPAQTAPGHRTCDAQDHRSLEAAYFTRGNAMFQLRARLKKAGVAVPDDSVPLGDAAGPVEVDADDCDGKPEGGNRRLRAIFGGRWTHNEQLIMRTCGVILSRATLFGSEAVSAVNLFAKATFPTPESTPEFFIFDNNCKLDAHQRAIHDDHFKNTGKPVDVFHFNCKHKVTDLHCQRYCNPAAFREMIGADGKWRFNTSICEQTNVWFGGYIAIVRDMEVTRYNFFLDEMIKRRNRYVVAELEAKGHSPWMVPMKALFPEAMEL
ncbi:hypothetical protein B0H16DRAFT_1323588 [Mycena metata]|uniref:CxC6 like cysteine cluster associated with KDZ domain-containing protein n=1 Tax=Mycena metata TaxID=1033252 RepID=A0AAD7IFF3_9AGAR|nr:hypothetical protein B0H16DRAFT_1323588 [Mycena metata]